MTSRFNLDKSRILKATTKRELMEAMDDFLENELPFDLAMDAQELSGKPNKQNMIKEYIKWAIDTRRFAEKGFVLVFKDPTFQIFKKYRYGQN